MNQPIAVDQARERALDRRVSRTRPRPGVARRLCVRGVLREGTRARLQEDLALHGSRRASPALGQLLHPRAQVPEHLDHHRARQGRRDPRLPQHLPAPRQQDAVGGRPLPGGVRAARHCCTAASTAGATSWTARCTRPPARICCSTSTPTAAGCRRCSARCGKASSSSTSTRTTPSRCATSSANWPTASRAIPSRGRTRSTDSRPSCSATGRSSSTASPRATTGRTCTPRRSAALTAEAREAFDQPNPFTDALAYQLKGPHRMFSFSGEPSQKDAVLQADRVRDGGQRGRVPGTSARPRADAAGDQSDAIGEVRLRLVPVLPQLRDHLRRVRIHHPHPLAHRARTRTSSRWRCTTSRRRRTRSGSARS